MVKQHNSVSPRAIVNTSRVGTDVKIGDFAVIAPNVLIGANTIIHQHVIINSGVEIGDNVEIHPGAVIGREPKGPGTLRHVPVFEPFVKIGKGCLIGAHVVIYYGVTIEEFALIGDAAIIREQCSIGRRCKVGQNAVLVHNVVVGDDSYVGNLVDLAGDTMVGSRVFIGACTVTANTNSFGSDYQGEPDRCAVRIEDDSRIGIGARLLPGVVIGRHSTVGAGAVVTRNVPPNATVMGIPAKSAHEDKSS
jgi:acetyltransferase-like isoleucine patch superfamily enzyme